MARDAVNSDQRTTPPVSPVLDTRQSQHSERALIASMTRRMAVGDSMGENGDTATVWILISWSEVTGLQQSRTHRGLDTSGVNPKGQVEAPGLYTSEGPYARD